MKQIGDLTVNDGKGLYDNEGLCKILIADLNTLPKLLIDNQFIEFSRKIGEMGQKLLNLHKGIRDDTESLKAKIEEQKKIIDELTSAGKPVERGNTDGND